MSIHRTTDTERGSRTSSPEIPSYPLHDGRIRPSVREGGGQQAVDSKPKPPMPGFPISHMLEFDTEELAERQALSARMSSEVGVPNATALAAIEAFGADTDNARKWLQTQRHLEQVRVDISGRTVVVLVLQYVLSIIVLTFCTSYVREVGVCFCVFA